MKKFVTYILVLIAMITVFLFALEFIYTRAFTNGIPRTKLQHVLHQKNLVYDYVFIGSSRTEFNIDCEIIEELTGKSCINYGISGTTLQDSYAIIELMDAQGVKINNVFVQVDYMFNDIEYSPKFRAQLLPYRHNEKVNEILERYDNNFSNKHLPFLRYIENDYVIGFREVFSLLIGKKPKTDFNNGYIPKFGKRNDIVRSLPNRIIGTNASIEAMKEHFKQKDINGFFFTAPICNTAIGRDYIDKLKIKIPELYNYVSIYDDKMEYYFDCGHLNSVGAAVFTQLLVEDLILKNN